MILASSFSNIWNFKALCLSCNKNIMPIFIYFIYSSTYPCGHRMFLISSINLDLLLFPSISLVQFPQYRHSSVSAMQIYNHLDTRVMKSFVAFIFLSNITNDDRVLHLTQWQNDQRNVVRLFIGSYTQSSQSLCAGNINLR